MVLRKYRETIEADSENIELLLPAGSAKPYFANFNWLPADRAVPVPGPDTLWQADADTLAPRHAIRAYASHAHEPAWFTTAPVGALKKLFEKTGWSAGKVDLFEINEAFAVVTLAAMRDLELPADKVNVHGGACALGHPIGASGARILVTLLAALEKYDLTYGAAALCIGGGEATAVALERLH